MDLLVNNDIIKLERFDNIIIMTWKIDLDNIDQVKQMVDLRLKVTQEDPYLFLVNIKNVKKISKEVRDFLASEKGAERVIAAAIITGSMITAIFANFFLKVNKPAVITKLFAEEDEAIKWLKTQNKDKIAT